MQAQAGLGVGVALPMNILPAFVPFVGHKPPPQQSALLRDAIQAHESRLLGSADDRAQALPKLVQKILGRPVDRIGFAPPLKEPVAIVDGLVFRGEADDCYSLKNGWLVVRTKHNGWREVRSLEQLGEIARREPLMLLEGE